MAAEAPLNSESSTGSTNLQITCSLPSEVVQCLQNARFVCPPPLPLQLFQLYSTKLTSSSTAPPRNLYQPLPSRLPHELHLPTILAPQQLSYHNNDHEPLIQENTQPNLQPTRLSTRPRLGLPSAPNHQPPGLRC
jgi:hypothetical protein